jgi:hypothetical protein
MSTDVLWLIGFILVGGGFIAWGVLTRIRAGNGHSRTELERKIDQFSADYAEHQLNTQILLDLEREIGLLRERVNQLDYQKGPHAPDDQAR